jgi:peroxiredoxin
MRKSILLFVFFLLISVGFLQAAKKPPAAGDVFPKIALPAPEARSEREYLGLSGSGKFEISAIRAPVVMLQIMSIYCPYCQKEAANVNELYRMIESDPDLRGRIVICGLGAGNSAYEVGAFRKKYAIPFPIIPDPDFAAYERIGEVRTPYFIVIRTSSDGAARVFYAEAGGLGDPARFLSRLRQLPELK